MDKRTDRLGKVCYYDVDLVTEWPSNVAIMNTSANIMFTTRSYLEYITQRGLQGATLLKQLNSETSFDMMTVW